ncbi:MAG: aminotransferase class I/II-fold pyridoxal phosphate-dependent enzyme, partial [Blastocatellia bacterium]
MESKADNYSNLFSQVGNGLTQNAIRKLSPLIARPDIISFAAGAPSPEVFPADELAEIASRVIRDRGRASLQYGPTRGNNSLLELIAEETRLRGIAVSGNSQLVITTGSQQGLDLISRILIDPGDIALVELQS